MPIPPARHGGPGGPHGPLGGPGGNPGRTHGGPNGGPNGDAHGGPGRGGPDESRGGPGGMRGHPGGTHGGVPRPGPAHRGFGDHGSGASTAQRPAPPHSGLGSFDPGARTPPSVGPGASRAADVPRPDDEPAATGQSAATGQPAPVDEPPDAATWHERVALPATAGGRAIAIVAVLAVVAALVVATRFGAPSMLASLTVASNPIVTADPPAPVTVDPSVRGLDSAAAAPSPTGIAAAIDGLASVPALGSLAGAVVDGSTGESLWARSPDTALVPGSTAKIVTGAAALLALDHAATLDTTVVAGAEPGTIVLVGGGDPTLSALPAGSESVYPGAPKLDDLVAQVTAADAGPITRVLVDVSRWSDDSMGPGWDPIDIGAGYIAPIVPVMLDGGRGVPTVADTPRSSTPARTAAAELARRLGVDPSTVAVGDAPAGARVLATVSSRPVEDLVEHALQSSDNVLAEVLAREVAMAVGAPTTFAGSMDAVRSTLQQAGIDTAGLQLVDGSGLSARNAVTAAGLAGLLTTAVSGSQPLLGPLTGGLPVAGGTGTLAGRYGDPAATAGRGYVRAKTGTLSGVSSLAGVVVDADGRLLVFALLSNGSVPAAARPALDAVAAALRSCGCD